MSAEPRGGTWRGLTRIAELRLFRHPLHRLRLYLVCGPGPGVLAAAAGQAADGTHRHVVVTGNLATEPHAGNALGAQDCFLGRRHLVRFPGEELDTTGRAAGVPAAGMELVDLGLICQGQHEALA